MKPNSNSNPNPLLPTPISNKPNMTSELPMELISDILKRLPIKTLLRFKCVSKPWLSLLTHPIFIKRHLNHHRSNSHTRLILTRYCDTLLFSDVSSDVMQAEELDFPMLRNLSYYVKGHSDGLLCVVVNDGEEGKLVLYNPCVGKYRKLPSPAGFRSTREAIGIGFDKNVGDYKVVRVPSSYCRMKVAGYKAKVEVLELKSNVWRQVGGEEDAHYSVEHVFQSTEVNGGLYWLAEDTRTGNGVILRFDLAEEKLKVVAPPREESGRNVSWVGALNGMLCVVHTRKLSEIQIWGTNDDRTWTKIVACSENPDYPPSVVVCDDWFRYMPLCYTEKGAVLISVRGERFLTFDNRTNKFEHVDIRGAESWLQETVYCESLVSPGVGVNPTEAAASSGSAINELTNEDEAEEDGENDIRSSILMMSDLKRELANLLACTVGLTRHTQGRDRLA